MIASGQRSVLSVLTLALASCVHPPEKPVGIPGSPVNVLFILTDQQRFDALSRAGNRELQTPNLDRLARSGAYFLNAYSPSPVCAPARVSILTGHSVGSTGVKRNSDLNSNKARPLPTFDNILTRAGYHTEYYGKWHAPYSMTQTYENQVRPSGKRRGVPDTVPSQVVAFRQFVETNVKSRSPGAGELLDPRSNRPYVPDSIDPRWRAQEHSLSATSMARNRDREMYGRLDLPREFSRTAFVVKEAMEALERIKHRPFSLTCSINSPHPPMLLSEPYHGMHPPETLALPVSISGSLINSPYRNRGLSDRKRGYQNPHVVRRMKASYYGLVREVDDWVGTLLDRLTELDLVDDTLVIFTSDHGEMLGDHGMADKGIFHEGAVHVPLLMSLPGRIPAGTVVETPVSTIDLFATILDYTGQPGHPSEGRSLRDLIDGTETSGPDYCVSERTRRFMVRTRRWKLILAKKAGGRQPDALYDLLKDPHELNNLIGDNPARERYRAPAEALKARLVRWLARIRSRDLQSVRQRPVLR